MAREGIEVRGLRELFGGSRRLFSNIEKRAAGDFERVAQQRAQMASARMPRKSGRMAAAVAARQTPGGAEVGLDQAGVPYAGWVEFGGSRGRPYLPGGRYLYPTALAAEGQLADAGKRGANDEIRGFRWARPS